MAARKVTVECHQKGTPFLIAGDSPQALMVNLSEKDAEFYFANRMHHGGFAT